MSAFASTRAPVARASASLRRAPAPRSAPAPRRAAPVAAKRMNAWPDPEYIDEVIAKFPDVSVEVECVGKGRAGQREGPEGRGLWWLAHSRRVARLFTLLSPHRP